MCRRGTVASEADSEPSNAGRTARARAEAWLRAFRELSLNPRAEVVTLLSDWVNLMTDSLDYEVAGAFECDFEGGRLFPWLGQTTLESAHHDTVGESDRAFILGSPICRPASYFSSEIVLDQEAPEFLLRTPSGLWNASQPSSNSGLRNLARALRLERFSWIVHFSRSGLRHADILLVSGFSRRRHEHTNERDDEQDFASLGRHVGSLIDNAGLVAELEQERAGLRQLNGQLDNARNQLLQIFLTLPGALLLTDRQHAIRSVNEAATRLLQCPEDALLGTSILQLFECADEIRADALAARGSVLRTETTCHAGTGKRIPVLLSAGLLPSSSETDGQPAGIVCVALDIGERKRLEIELREAQKLESVGRLAAGIAHEINTPVQFVGDNVHFVRGAMGELRQLIERYRDLRQSVQAGKGGLEEAKAAARAEEDADIDFFLGNAPEALERATEGLDRVAAIVRAMKEFAHPAQTEMVAADINRCVQSTLTVARNEYKYVAEVVTDLGAIPFVACLIGEINQVILNVLVNAAHAIADRVKNTDKKGCITVRTRAEHDAIVLSIGDDGGGIPEVVRHRIYDPFFTTKEVGRGTGQGLAIARSVVVDKHGGELWFETEMGIGTTFFIRLPIARKMMEPSGLIG
jgi:two-component system, NtrC family, sensor kinase